VPGRRPNLNLIERAVSAAVELLTLPVLCSNRGIAELRSSRIHSFSSQLRQAAAFWPALSPPLFPKPTSLRRKDTDENAVCRQEDRLRASPECHLMAVGLDRRPLPLHTTLPQEMPEQGALVGRLRPPRRVGVPDSAGRPGVVSHHAWLRQRRYPCWKWPIVFLAGELVVDLLDYRQFTWESVFRFDAAPYPGRLDAPCRLVHHYHADSDARYEHRVGVDRVLGREKVAKLHLRQRVVDIQHVLLR